MKSKTCYLLRSGDLLNTKRTDDGGGRTVTTMKSSWSRRSTSRGWPINGQPRGKKTKKNIVHTTASSLERARKNLSLTFPEKNISWDGYTKVRVEHAFISSTNKLAWVTVIPVFYSRVGTVHHPVLCTVDDTFRSVFRKIYNT